MLCKSSTHLLATHDIPTPTRMEYDGDDGSGDSLPAYLGILGSPEVNHGKLSVILLGTSSIRHS